jgi:peptidyl-prolyl cis-trans isomerase C
VKSITPEPEVRARHILVESEDEAKAVHARVKGGEDFNKVAAEASKDPGSKDEGGDLGFFAKDRMVEPFAEAAFKLEPGPALGPDQDPVRLARDQGRGEAHEADPGFREMKEQVEAYLGRKAQQDLIVGLRQNAKVERLDEKGNLVEQKKP